MVTPQIPAGVTRAQLGRVDRPTPAAFTLPRQLFTDRSVFDAEADHLFWPAWHCVARLEDFARPGDFRTFEVCGSGFFVVRDAAGTLRAYHNVCRHRGTRLIEAAEGSGLTRIQCPYHAWTYGLDGHLAGAPDVSGIQGFDRADYGLHPAALEVWRGFVFVNLTPRPRPLREYLGGLEQRASPFPLEELRRVHRVVYDIEANWKLVVENANECYHCPSIHPQLVRLTPHRSGGEDLVEGPVFGGWMDFVKDVDTLTASGRTSRPAFPGLSDEDRRRVYYYVLYPANFLAFLPDYVTLDWFLPLGPDRTRLVFDMFVDGRHPDPATDAMEFWDTTNRQDWHICELAQRGARTVAYTQGRYSMEEDTVHRVDRFYVRKMGWGRRPRRS